MMITGARYRSGGLCGRDRTRGGRESVRAIESEFRTWARVRRIDRARAPPDHDRPARNEPQVPTARAAPHIKSLRARCFLCSPAPLRPPLIFLSFLHRHRRCTPRSIPRNSAPARPQSPPVWLPTTTGSPRRSSSSRSHLRRCACAARTRSSPPRAATRAPPGRPRHRRPHQHQRPRSMPSTPVATARPIPPERRTTAVPTKRSGAPTPAQRAASSLGARAFPPRAACAPRLVSLAPLSSRTRFANAGSRPVGTQGARHRTDRAAAAGSPRAPRALAPARVVLGVRRELRLAHTLPSTWVRRRHARAVPRGGVIRARADVLNDRWLRTPAHDYDSGTRV
jgi:hypothetical protein